MSNDNMFSSRNKKHIHSFLLKKVAYLELQFVIRISPLSMD